MTWHVGPHSSLPLYLDFSLCCFPQRRAKINAKNRDILFWIETRSRRIHVAVVYGFFTDWRNGRTDGVTPHPPLINAHRPTRTTPFWAAPLASVLVLHRLHSKSQFQQQKHQQPYRRNIIYKPSQAQDPVYIGYIWSYMGYFQSFQEQISNGSILYWSSYLFILFNWLVTAFITVIPQFQPVILQIQTI